jgi:TusA-related sulfurtransferase
MEEDIVKIDCFGDICPVPVIKAENQLRSMKPGEEFLLITDHSCTAESIREKYGKRKMIKSIQEVMNGVWEIVLVKR